MGKSEKDPRAAIERWVDERIRLAFAGLARPFEKRISSLRERVQGLQARVRAISRRMEEEREQRPGKGRPPGREGSRGEG